MRTIPGVYWIFTNGCYYGIREWISDTELPDLIAQIHDDPNLDVVLCFKQAVDIPPQDLSDIILKIERNHQNPQDLLNRYFGEVVDELEVVE